MMLLDVPAVDIFADLSAGTVAMMVNNRFITFGSHYRLRILSNRNRREID